LRWFLPGCELLANLSGVLKSPNRRVRSATDFIARHTNGWLDWPLFEMAAALDSGKQFPWIFSAPLVAKG
jgi:hypothetical protein